MVAVDLRGHGMSEMPLEAEQYVDGDKWADDVAAIIDQLTLDKPMVVGWSYGGFVILDYPRWSSLQHRRDEEHDVDGCFRRCPCAPMRWRAD